MNFKNILNAIHEEDPEVFEKLSPRRHILKSFSSKVAVAALPFAIGSLFKKAYGQTNGMIYDTLKFALTLEYLEDAFYKKALEKPWVFPTLSNMNVFEKISKNESSHVSFLQGAITAMGNIVPPPPNIDLTGGFGSGEGPYKNFFEKYGNLLSMAYSLEDLGVRAYKGQLDTLTSDNSILKAALALHSVEARHAAQIRLMRFEMGGVEIKPWITGNTSASYDVFFETPYGGEENTTHGGINVVAINGEDVSFEAATEAFDEPMSADDVLKYANRFIY